jgi:hypothetical protein
VGNYNKQKYEPYEYFENEIGCGGGQNILDENNFIFHLMGRSDIMGCFWRD